MANDFNAAFPVPSDLLVCRDPATGERLGEVPVMDRDAVVAAVQRGREAQAAWAKTTFAERRAFCALSEPLSGHTADRLEFPGRNGSMADPAGLRAARLGSRTGTGHDPCAVLQCVVELAPGE
jgi:cellobiose phosphorylase